jgi:hypothetical protein
MEQGVVVSEHEPLVITNEPATSITHIVKKRGKRKFPIQKKERRK